MVGIPGKSGGCATCRRKKKGCDKKTPFCGQCVQAGLVCEGYNRNCTVWINYDENRKYIKKSAASRPTAYNTRQDSGSTPGTPSSSIVLHESFARAAREDRYVGLYLAAFLPNGRLFSRPAAQISSAGWLKHHDELCRSEKTLRFITLAHGLSMMATRDGDDQFKFKGWQAYRMALQEMRTAVEDPKRATSDGLLAAVRLFRFYEILYGADSEGPKAQTKGFYAHTDGEMALFMNRGPHRKWSEAGRYLLASGRIVSFILGVNRRKRSPFSDNGWLTAPWKDAPKSILDELVDIMVQTPGLLEELDTIRSIPIAKRTPETWNDLLDSCSSIERALLVWKTIIGDDLQTYDYTHYSGDYLPIPRVDRDFAILHLSFFYWSCSIVVYTTIHMAATEADNFSHCSPIPFSSPGSPNYYSERNPTLHAHRIMHAMRLSYEPHAGGFGKLSSTFPLGMSLRYLMLADSFPHEGNSRDTEKMFLQTMLSQPFMRSFVARFLGNIHRMGGTPAAVSPTDMPGWEGVEAKMRRWWFGPDVSIEQ